MNFDVVEKLADVQVAEAIVDLLPIGTRIEVIKKNSGYEIACNGTVIEQPVGFYTSDFFETIGTALPKIYQQCMIEQEAIQRVQR